MEQGAPSFESSPKNKRKRLKEFLRVQEIGSHVNRVRGTLENIVFKGMEESEKEIRAKRMWFSVFALVLLIALGVTLSRHAQSEVAIFHPSACLGGWMEIDKATGPPETASGATFSNANSAILPENTVADMFCGEFKGEIPEDTQPKVLMLRIAWSVDGSTSTQVIEGESFASSTIEILDAPASTSPDFMLVEPEITTSTEVTPSASTTEEQINSPSGTRGEETAPTPSEMTAPEPTPPTETPEVPVEDPQSIDTGKKTFTFLKKLFVHAYAQEVPTEESTTTPGVLESPVDTPPPIQETKATKEPSVLEAPIDTPSSQPLEPAEAASAIELPIDTPPPTQETEVAEEPSVLEAPINTPVATTSETYEDATTTDSEIASSSTEETFHESPLFDILYSFDGTTWETLGSVTLEQLPATQFEIPLKDGSSWGDLSKLQIHIKRNPSIDIAPTIFLDAITLEVEVLRIPHEEPVHPDFERDVVVRDVTENGMRIVTIVNADTQQEETWYMYLDEGVFATSTPESASTTDTFATTTTATSTNGVALSTTTDFTASSTDIITATEMRLPQMKEKNVWKKYVGTTTLPTFTDVAEQESIPSLEQAASSTEVVEEEIILDLLPDLAADKIRRIKGVFLNSIIVQVIGKTKDELWLYNAENETKERVEAGTSTSVSVGYPFGIKDGFIFWLSHDGTVAYAYNPETKVFLEQSVPPFDVSLGERAEITFPDILWKVIVNKDKFTFYSTATGEVFSDEDSIVQDTLRRKFNLDTVLNSEKLNQLDFSIESAGGGQ